MAPPSLRTASLCILSRCFFASMPSVSQIGVTTAASDKEDKTRAHQRTRRAAKQALRAGAEECLDRRATENAWSYAKDGKTWFGAWRPELMRK